VKTIRTRFHGPTNTLGARIIAEDGEGRRTITSYPYELNTDDAHRSAASDWVFKHSKLSGVIKLTPAWFKSDCYWTVSN
jgi:hypothetical protein